MAKGSAYEREVCKALSLWWTDGKHDDVFWRSSQSGGRATQRAKKGKRTFGSYGDITAIDPEGKPLLDAFTIELKRGYNACSFADLVDRPAKAGVKGVEDFIVQARRSAAQAQSMSWMLIHRRDKKLAMVYISGQVYRQLQSSGAFVAKLPGVVQLWTTIRRNAQEVKAAIVIIPLHIFLKEVKPEHVTKLIIE